MSDVDMDNQRGKSQARFHTKQRFYEVTNRPTPLYFAATSPLPTKPNQAIRQPRKQARSTRSLWKIHGSARVCHQIQYVSSHQSPGASLYMKHIFRMLFRKPRIKLYLHL